MTMGTEIKQIASISELHDHFGYPKPKHPLITLLDTSTYEVTEDQVGSKSASNLYMIGVKDKSCGVEYGRN